MYIFFLLGGLLESRNMSAMYTWAKCLHFGSSELDLSDQCERSSLSLFEFIFLTQCLLTSFHWLWKTSWLRRTRWLRQPFVERAMTLLALRSPLSQRLRRMQSMLCWALPRSRLQWALRCKPRLSWWTRRRWWRPRMKLKDQSPRSRIGKWQTPYRRPTWNS